MSDYKPTDPNAPITEPLDKATNEKFDKMAQRKVLKLLAILTGDPDSREFMTAARALPQALTSAGLDIYVLISRIEHGKGDEEYSAGALQKVWDAGYTKGHADGTDSGRRSAIIATAMPMGVLDTSDVGPGVNGYSWLEIARYCADNKQRIYRDKDREFIDSVLEQMTYRHKAPSPPQAKWLRDIFNQRFGGRID